MSINIKMKIDTGNVNQVLAGLQQQIVALTKESVKSAVAVSTAEKKKAKETQDATKKKIKDDREYNIALYQFVKQQEKAAQAAAKEQVRIHKQQLKEQEKADREYNIALKQFEDAQKKRDAAEAKKKSKNPLGAIGSGFATAAAGYALVAAAAYKAAEMVGSFIEASNKQELADKQLESSLQATGRATPLKEFKDFASQIQDTTTFGDEEVQSALKLAATFKNLSDGSMKDVVKTATNVSSALGIDLDAATKSVAQALARPENAGRKLRAMNIILTKSEEDKIKALTESGKTAEAQAAVMDIINSKYAGMAEATAGTTAGMMKQTKNLIGDTKEQIGDLIKGMIQPIMADLIPALKNINKWFTENKDKIGSVIDFVRIGLVAIPPILLLIKVNSLQAAAANVTMGASTGAISAGFKAAAVASKAFLVSLGPILVATLAIAAAVKMAQWYDEIKKTQEAADASIAASNATWQAAKTRAVVMRQAADDIRRYGMITEETLGQMKDAGIEEVKVTKANAAEKAKLFELSAKAEDEKYRKGAEAHKKQVADTKKTNKELTEEEKAALEKRKKALEDALKAEYEYQQKLSSMRETNHKKEVELSKARVWENLDALESIEAAELAYQRDSAYSFEMSAEEKRLIDEGYYNDLILLRRKYFKMRSDANQNAANKPDNEEDDPFADLKKSIKSLGMTENPLGDMSFFIKNIKTDLADLNEGELERFKNGMSALEGIKDNLATGFSSVFETMLTNINDVDNAILKMGEDFIATVAKMAMNTLAGKVATGLLSFFGLSSGGMIPGYAAGGIIHAAGGTGVLSGGVPDRDSIPALLMPGEAVLNRAAVRNIGGESGVNALNSGGGIAQPNITIIQQIGTVASDRQQAIELERAALQEASQIYNKFSVKK